MIFIFALIIPRTFITFSSWKLFIIYVPLVLKILYFREYSTKNFHFLKEFEENVCFF